MKKEIYSSHTEILIDKDYNEREKAQVHFGRDLIILAIVFVILAINMKNGTKELFFASLALSWFSIISIDGLIGEYKLNKRIYPYTVVFGCATVAGTLFALLCYYGAFGDEFKNIFLVFGVFFAIMIVSVFGYVCVRSLINKKERTVTVFAVCFDNLSEEKERYSDNMMGARSDRARSVAYAGSEYITIFTPLFRFDYNGMTYEAKSNISKDVPLPVGSVHQLKINPKNPTEISLILKKESNQ